MSGAALPAKLRPAIGHRARDVIQIRLSYLAVTRFIEKSGNLLPGLCLENSGQMMYGVGIQLNAASTLVQDLVGIDLGSIQPGGTAPDGSVASINYVLVTGNFPNNYNFSASDDFTVPGTPITPAPEPGVMCFSFAGGIALLWRWSITRQGIKG